MTDVHSGRRGARQGTAAAAVAVSRRGSRRMCLPRAPPPTRRHPRHRHGRDRRRARAGVRQHAVLLPRDGERQAKLPAAVAAAVHQRAGAGGPLPSQRPRHGRRAPRLCQRGEPLRRRRRLARAAPRRRRRHRRGERRDRGERPVDAALAAALRRQAVAAQLRHRRVRHRRSRRAARSRRSRSAPAMRAGSPSPAATR